MKYLISLAILFSSSIAIGQTSKTLPNRALDQDLKLCVNDGGVEKCPIVIDGPTGNLEAKGVTDGSAAAAGEIGERIAASITSNTNTSVADTPVDVNGASIALTAGQWEIKWGATISIENSSGGAANIYARVAVTDSGDTALAGGSFFVGINQPNVTTIYPHVSGSVSLNISSSDTYKLRLTCSFTQYEFDKLRNHQHENTTLLIPSIRLMLNRRSSRPRAHRQNGAGASQDRTPQVGTRRE